MPKPLSTAPQNTKDEVLQYPAGGQYWTSDPAGESKILFANKGVASEKGTPAKTIIEIFKMAVKRAGDKVALRTENMPALKKGEKAPEPLPLNQWKSWTWKQYLTDVQAVSKALIELGMVQHDSVNVFGFNSPEWFIAQMSAIFAGGKVAGIYPSDNAEQVQFKSDHSNASIAFVETDNCFSKFKAIVDQLPYLKVIVCWACDAGEDITRSDGTVIKTMSFKDVLEMGKKIEDATLETRISAIKPTHCCALIYTSGTTGKPKAVMVSHDNIAFESNTVLPLTKVGATAEEERILSYLPLSHVAGLMVDCIAPVVVTAYKPGWVSVSFARVYDLKVGTLGQRLATVEPTLFLGVPRVWEKIAEKLQAIGAQTTGLLKTLATTAKSKGLQASSQQQIGGSGKTPMFYGLYKIILNKIKAKLGLSKCKYAFSGAAPMTKDTLNYFGSLGINVNDAYGMSECVGAACMSTEEAHQWGTVGFEIPGVEVRCFQIDEVTGEKTECPRAEDIFKLTEKEQGELCFRGRNVMMGYMANPKLGEEHVNEIAKKNSDAIDSDGWLHSGDKGAISTLGMVRITGRYKELIIGAGGENIAPVPLEDNIKKLCPYISNALMVGDKRKFNVVLLTLKCIGATGELPGTTNLEKDYQKYGKTVKDAASNKELIAAITKAITDTNKDGDCCPSNAAKIQKFTILPVDFSVTGDELTATLKTKRSVVTDKYEAIIDAMYASKDAYVPYSEVGSFDVEAGAAPSTEVESGSFKGNEPLNLVDEADVKVASAN